MNRLRTRAALAGMIALAALGAIAAPMVASAQESDTNPTSLVEDYTYPGAAQIEQERGITLVRGDGRITLADCDGNSELIKIETLTQDACFLVDGDTGWLAVRVDAVFLVGAGDQDVAVTVEGMSAPISIPEGNSRPVQAVDPTRRGIVVEIRATAPAR